MKHPQASSAIGCATFTWLKAKISGSRFLSVLVAHGDPDRNQRAGQQSVYTEYRGVFRWFYYDGDKNQLVLPPENNRTFNFGTPQHGWVDGHECMAARCYCSIT